VTKLEQKFQATKLKIDFFSLAFCFGFALVSFFSFAWSRILIDCHLIFTFYKRSKMVNEQTEKKSKK